MRHFAIGIAAKCFAPQRTSQYYPQVDGWSPGFLPLFEYRNPSTILHMETRLIDHFRETKNPFLTNKNRGGGGNPNPEHGSWVVYLKLAKVDTQPGPHWYAKKKMLQEKDDAVEEEEMVNEYRHLID